MQFEPDGVDIPAVPGGETWVALFQNEIPRETTESIIMKAKEAGCLIMWNIAPTIGRRPEKQVLQAVDYLVCNRNELQALVGGEGDLESQAEVPLGWGVRNMIVTLGVKGSFWRCGREIYHQAAFPVEAVDAVGAGDCYCGVLAAALATALRSRPPSDAHRLPLQYRQPRRGAQPSMPTGPEIDDFLKKRGE